MEFADGKIQIIELKLNAGGTEETHPSKGSRAGTFLWRPVKPEILSTVASFFALYVAVFAVASVLMTGLGMDFLSAVSSVATCMGGCGPGLGTVGPMSNYADVPVIGKRTLSACTLLGRLELFTVFIISTRSFWKV